MANTTSNHLRMIGVFGHREMELAALVILDGYWSQPFMAIDPTRFTDNLEKTGLEELVQMGWLKRDGDVVTATIDFWERVHGR